MSETEFAEYAGLVLEDQLLDHLATPEGAMAIWKERLDPEIIPDSDEGIREALIFVQRYIDQYRIPPTPDILSDETGYREFADPQAPVAYVIERLRDRHRRTTLKRVVTKVARMTSDPEAALNYAQEALAELKTQTRLHKNSVTERDFHTTLDDYIRSQQQVEEGLASFGYEEIDQHLSGHRIGEVVVIYARPKRYKSWQLTKSAVSTYLQGKNVAVGTMEMSAEVMRNRVHCMIAGVSWYRFSHKLLSDIEQQRLTDAADLMADSENRMHIFRPKPGERTVANIRAEAIEAEADLLLIDQLSWFDGVKDEGSWRIIGKIMEDLKDAAVDFPIYMAAQYGRAAAQEDGLADISKGGLADFIGQTADTLLGIYASKDMLANKILHLGVLDSREFEPITWEIKVELSEHSDFKFLNVVADD